MADKRSRLDPQFLEKQRRRLIELRRRILAVRQGQESEQASDSEAQGQAREYEDDAQHLAALELQGNLAAADVERMRSIERALQKIGDGTYGLSDGSGAPIPLERLEASPEALYTLEEQKSRDALRINPAR
jgi:DnaK suppressor protein